MKFGGTQQVRYVTTATVDAEDIYRVTVKVAREMVKMVETDQKMVVTNFCYITTLIKL